jgi:hypothetical protein
MVTTLVCAMRQRIGLSLIFSAILHCPARWCSSAFSADETPLDGQGGAGLRQDGRGRPLREDGTSDIIAYKRGRKSLVDLDSIDAMNARDLKPWKLKKA